MYIQITIHEHSRTPHRNLQPDRCGPVLPLATTNLDFTPPPNPLTILHTNTVSMEGKLINLLMSYRLELKLFFILKLVANPGFHL